MWIMLIVLVSSIEVFIVPHSHNDPGWNESIDWYYTNFTRDILNNVITLLKENPLFKFSWAETIFLSMWLKENPDQKSLLKSFITQKRFEIVGGGWVQNDEALVDFELVIRQMELGHSYLKEELNVTNIKIGWQIDPFGHSSLTPALFEKMGFEALVMSRIDARYLVAFI